MRAAIIIPLALVTIACGDLSTPAELAHPQILAVRAEAPAIPAGSRTRLEVFVAGPDGMMEPLETRWSVIPRDPTAPPLGTIELDDGEPYYVAPVEVDEFTVAAVQVEAVIDDVTTLPAIKAIGVGVPQPTANPTIETIRVDGEPIAEGEVLHIPVDGVAILTYEADPPATDDTVVSWHATTGELDGYLFDQAELTAPDAPTTGELFLVHRDGAGGVALYRIALDIR